MLLESPENWKDYELVDSGNFEKLERFGDFVIARPEPKALWDKSLSDREWQTMVHTRFVPGAGFGKAGKEDSGSWKMIRKMPEQWVIRYNKEIAAKGDNKKRLSGLDLRLRLGLTSFKHVGVFPEQAPNWDFIYEQTGRLVAKAKSTSLKGEYDGKTDLRARSGKEGVVKVLNLFAYTGAASLAARAAGADVTHLDSVRQVVTWAKNNMELSGLDNIRWVVEDAMKYVRREAKRGNVYNGIILDPPAYGHGPNGETWKLDELLYELLVGCSQILAPKEAFMVLNLYSNGYSAMLADTAVKSAFGLLSGKEGVSLSCGELMLKDSFGKAVPLSVFSRLTR